MKEKEKQSSLLVDIVARMEEAMKNPRVVTLDPESLEKLSPEEEEKRKEEFFKKWEHRRIKV